MMCASNRTQGILCKSFKMLTLYLQCHLSNCKPLKMYTCTYIHLITPISFLKSICLKRNPYNPKTEHDIYIYS